MAKRSANKGRGSLADEVLQYLIDHKRAHATKGNPSDTVEGIVAWWLPLQRIQYAINEVEAALRDLVVKKLVIARKMPDGRLHYRMNPKKKQTIRRYFKRKAARPIKGTTRSSKAPKRC